MTPLRRSWGRQNLALTQKPGMRILPTILQSRIPFAVWNKDGTPLAGAPKDGCAHEQVSTAQVFVARSLCLSAEGFIAAQL